MPQIRTTVAGDQRVTILGDVRIVYPLDAAGTFGPVFLGVYNESGYTHSYNEHGRTLGYNEHGYVPTFRET